MKKKINKSKSLRKKKIRLISSIDDFYKIINKVQIEKQELSLFINKSDIEMYDNILKDLKLLFIKTEKKECYKYNISPSGESVSEKINEQIEHFPDEILEDGEIFF